MAAEFTLVILNALTHRIRAKKLPKIVAGKANLKLDLFVREAKSSLLSRLKSIMIIRKIVPAISLSSVTHKLDARSRTGFIIVTLNPMTVIAAAP